MDKLTDIHGDTWFVRASEIKCPEKTHNIQDALDKGVRISLLNAKTGRFKALKICLFDQQALKGDDTEIWQEQAKIAQDFSVKFLKQVVESGLLDLAKEGDELTSDLKRLVFNFKRQKKAHSEHEFELVLSSPPKAPDKLKPENKDFAQTLALRVNDIISQLHKREKSRFLAKIYKWFYDEEESLEKVISREDNKESLKKDLSYLKEFLGHPDQKELISASHIKLREIFSFLKEIEKTHSKQTELIDLSREICSHESFSRPIEAFIDEIKKENQDETLSRVTLDKQKRFLSVLKQDLVRRREVLLQLETDQLEAKKLENMLYEPFEVISQNGEQDSIIADLEVFLLAKEIAINWLEKKGISLNEKDRSKCYRALFYHSLVEAIHKISIKKGIKGLLLRGKDANSILSDQNQFKRAKLALFEKYESLKVLANNSKNDFADLQDFSLDELYLGAEKSVVTESIQGNRKSSQPRLKDLPEILESKQMSGFKIGEAIGDGACGINSFIVSLIGMVAQGQYSDEILQKKLNSGSSLEPEALEVYQTCKGLYAPDKAFEGFPGDLSDGVQKALEPFFREILINELKRSTPGVKEGVLIYEPDANTKVKKLIESLLSEGAAYLLKDFKNHIGKAEEKAEVLTGTLLDPIMKDESVLSAIEPLKTNLENAYNKYKLKSKQKAAEGNSEEISSLIENFWDTSDAKTLYNKFIIDSFFKGYIRNLEEKTKSWVLDADLHILGEFFSTNEHEIALLSARAEGVQYAIEYPKSAYIRENADGNLTDNSKENAFREEELSLLFSLGLIQSNSRDKKKYDLYFQCFSENEIKQAFEALKMKEVLAEDSFKVLDEFFTENNLVNASFFEQNESLDQLEAKFLEVFKKYYLMENEKKKKLLLIGVYNLQASHFDPLLNDFGRYNLLDDGLAPEVKNQDSI